MARVLPALSYLHLRDLPKPAMDQLKGNRFKLTAPPLFHIIRAEESMKTILRQLTSKEQELQIRRSSIGQPQLPNTITQGPAHTAQQQYPQHAQHAQPINLPYQHAPQPERQKPKAPQEDLLTSPFETNLPVPASDIAPPPIPPNPQKDSLLQALSQTLTQQIQSTHASNMSAIPPLRAQQAALNDTLNNINREVSQLNDLQGVLESNEKILHQAMMDADKVLDDAKRRDVPAVEEVLVAPTVVARQLYENVIEERVLEECRTVMGKALDKGRIGGDIWAKQTRSLAREEFLKKALIKKISRGMGLVEEERWD
ncbi:MAG: hypothetical protein LQ344_001872 [Seirophora lacunosa]|nr:MAG: hypothetical protein LQ344_001872 [Seirophora lacunosa]